ncbi:YbaN family protein [Sulfitobacter sp. SK012]|uniref:YbaN family protein n=1 Tax=Sulfitobacter sp. SK012 TaxID=1389005 RepID=UPI0015758FC7|nr:YbaN family protein [Sulfitobacter sp. SK012]
MVIKNCIGTLPRLAWLSVGLLALGIGAFGAVLPLLPTTPFVLLAAFAFARGSPRLRFWLVEHRVFGSIIADWESHGAIARRYKVLACCVMAITMIGSFLMGFPTTVLIIQLLTLSAAATYVLTRPSAGGAR